ncbi:MAG: hypothetical protein ACOC5J_03310 [Gemmatimonadota bacterium]
MGLRVRPWGIVRETGDEPDTHDAIWRIGFPDDTRARIRVTEDALKLDDEGFEALVSHLEEADVLGLLRKVSPGGVRIFAGGELEELGPEGIEAEG